MGKIRKGVKPFKNSRITLGEIRKAVNADKAVGIYKPIKGGKTQ